MVSVEDIRKEIQELIKEGNGFCGKTLLCSIDSYSSWYTRGYEIVKTLAPDRLDDFVSVYKNQNDRNGIDVVNYVTYSDRIGASRIDNLIRLQIGILESCLHMLDPIYAEMSNVVYFEYQEDELCEASALFKINVRAAGALAGVILEKHLKRVCRNHSIPGMDDKTLGVLISELYKKRIIDITKKKKLDYLADVRNTCSHSKDREPTSEDVSDLIDQTRKCIALIS